MDRIAKILRCINDLADLFRMDENAQQRDEIWRNMRALTSILEYWRGDNDKLQDGITNHPCQRCGNCCLAIAGEVGEASLVDIATWISLKRYDILNWVDPVFNKPLDIVQFDIWISPATHDYVKVCPWLKKIGPGKYACGIQDVKPKICREFPGNRQHAERFNCPIYRNI